MSDGPNFVVKLDKIRAFNQDLYKLESKNGGRATFFEQFGGLKGLEDVFRTDLENGLPGSEAVEQTRGERTPFAKRMEWWGSNEMPQPKSKPFWKIVWEHCLDETIIILTAAAILSLALGSAFPETFYSIDCQCTVTDSTGWVEGVAILVAVLVIILVGSIQDWDKERKFRALGSEDKRFIKVIRAGETVEVKTNQVLVGDVVLLEWGKYVPADGYLISGQNVKIDESSVTGEAEPVSKNIGEDMWLMANCSVTAGSGRMLVGGTGVNSEWGHTLLSLQEDEPEDTPLQKDLGKLVEGISKFGLFFGVITFFVLAIYWAIDVSNLIRVTGWDNTYIQPLVDALIIGITLLVVGIPEGLPLAVIISLAYSMKAMTKDNNLVRHLQACETMGGATNICSDKTGTLTQNKMTVQSGWFGGRYFGKVPWGQELQLVASYWEMMRVGLAVNTTAMRQIDEETKQSKVVGMPTEMALLDMVDKVDGSDGYYIAMRKEMEQFIVKQEPYNSEKKRMSTIVYIPERDVLRIFVKGAPEICMAESTHLYHEQGQTVPMNEEIVQEINECIREMSNKGYRTLLMGHKDVPAGQYLHRPGAAIAAKEEGEGRYYVDLEADPIDRGELVVWGVVGIEDPVREEVPDAVKRCIGAGITVRMLTGDHPGTAMRIAEQCHIKTARGVVLTGEEFRAMSDEAVIRIMPQFQVMARCQPADKLRLVRLLRGLDQIVAVTGDGTNDAPALKEADVGLAMGIAGTDVAKEASDIIIMDDNFKSIVSAVKWGRNVYEGVRKFLQFQLTVNIAGLMLVFIGAVSRYGATLRAVQLLWVNLIMDTLAALALATEPPTDELLLQTPHGKTERIVNNIMWKHILGHAAYQLGVMLAILYAGYLIPWTTGLVTFQGTRHYTLVFNAFVWCQLFNELNARSIDDHQNIFKGLHRSYIFMVVLVVSAGLQVLIVEVGGEAFKVEGLSWDQWLFCIAIGAVELPIGFILRAIPVPERHFVDLLQFWNKDPPVRVTRKVIEDFEGEEYEMIEANLLSDEDALAEIEREKERKMEARRLLIEETREEMAQMNEEDNKNKDPDLK